jgi:hypothetical protein
MDHKLGGEIEGRKEVRKREYDFGHLGWFPEAWFGGDMGGLDDSVYKWRSWFVE